MDAFSLVIFGATGNLAEKKLLPALFELADQKYLPENISIVGIGRKPFTTDNFREHYFNSVISKRNLRTNNVSRSKFKSYGNKISYLQGDITDDSLYLSLKELLNSKSGDKENNRIFYLATYPELYETVFNKLQKHGLNDKKNGWVRVIIEKPIGKDTASAEKLNKLLLKYYIEDEIYRLDHYLGKETLQNVLTFRFGNGLLEPIFSNEFVDHLQVTVAEETGIGERGGYYDSVGALKDVGQNHVLQMIALAIMESPKSFSNRDITDERIKALNNLTPEPDSLVFGQYKGYCNENNVLPNSKTDTFFAFRTKPKDGKLKGVPIYVRAGRKMKRTVTEIQVVFKPSKNRVFRNFQLGENPNVLTYRIKPNEGVALEILTKIPGHQIKLVPTFMQFCYKTLSDNIPGEYERLILDVIKGDQTFFIDAPEVIAQWKFTDQLAAKKIFPIPYRPGSWGPKKADTLIEKNGRKWIEPSMELCKL